MAFLAVLTADGGVPVFTRSTGQIKSVILLFLKLYLLNLVKLTEFLTVSLLV